LYDNIFSWDEDKNSANILKHGISFSEAASVFDDGDALYMPDEAHSKDEERFIIIGMSEKLNILMVCHCYRNEGSLIRLISARKANQLETAQYNRR
jgi:uncharacterized DUF497 family protein